MPNIAMISDLEANLHDLNDAWRRAERVGTPRLTFIDTGFWTDIGVEDYRDYLHALVPTLESLAQAGGERVILGMPLFRMDDAERMLDQLCDATAIEV